MTDANTEIDITGIDKVKLLQALYRNTKPLGRGVFQNRPDGLTQDEAREALQEGMRGGGKFDYVFGRPIKVRLTKTTLERADLYDRDAGPGACQRAVDEVRNETS